MRNADASQAEAMSSVASIDALAARRAAIEREIVCAEHVVRGGERVFQQTTTLSTVLGGEHDQNPHSRVGANRRLWRQSSLPARELGLIVAETLEKAFLVRRFSSPRLPRSETIVSFALDRSVHRLVRVALARYVCKCYSLRSPFPLR